MDKTIFALGRSPEVDANSAELRAEGGEDCEVGGLVIEVVAAAVAEVGRAAERFRGGGRSVKRDILHLLFKPRWNVYRVSRHLADLGSG